MIYLDNAATTPVDSDVIKVIQESLENEYGNPSSIYQLGRQTREIVESSRKVFAQSIHAKPEDIIITSGGTESNNTAIIATALSLQNKGKHLITTATEHHSVLHPMNYLETLGFQVTYLPVDQEGRVTVEQVKEAIRPNTILVSIIYGNNEVGSINPILDIGKMLKKEDILFHTDAVQAYGNIEMNVIEEEIDMLSVTAHKLNGPKGIGFLYRNHQLHLPHFVHGGTQENDHRAGTENIAYISGFAKAVENMLKYYEKNNSHKLELKEFFIQELKKQEIDFAINGMQEEGLPHIINLWIPHLQSDKLLIQCDLKGIMLSAGSACTAGSIEPSHVLQAMFGKESPRMKESIRVSFGKQNTKEEVVVLVDLIGSLQKKYKD